MPTPDPQPPNRPAGANGSKFSACMTGSVSTTKAISAVTLIATRTVLNLALSDVPRTSKAVISSAIVAAGRLMKPPG